MKISFNYSKYYVQLTLIRQKSCVDVEVALAQVAYETKASYVSVWVTQEPSSFKED